MYNEKLLTREQFRNAVFDRDGHVCVFCGEPAVDAHHILERRLWNDGGYYISNGASVCEKHHIECEKTLISVDKVRDAAGINRVLVPPHMYPDYEYDKWGNTIMANGLRTRGELFFDESVQKILSEVMGEFTNRVKYSRTYHVPWSPGMMDDDRMIPSMDVFKGQEVVVTEKLDGENTTMYCDGIHARSVDGRHHSSRNWVKNFWSTFSHDIPKDWRVCGENMYATHSIHYDSLKTYFYGFSVWNEKNQALSWDDTLEWFKLLNIEPVPVLYRGIYDEKKIRSLYSKSDWYSKEGYIVRLASSFDYRGFKNSVAKFVREGHVQTIKHWMHGQPIVPNELDNEKN